MTDPRPTPPEREGRPTYVEGGPHPDPAPEIYPPRPTPPVSVEITMVETKCVLNWWSLDQALRAFRAELDGPLRTAPEDFPGDGGCPAINPRHRLPWWCRWWVAQNRLHLRWAARRRWLMANHEWLGLSVPRAAALLPLPIWRTR